MENALIGGLLIGVTASLLLLIKGRIFGVTGILAGLLQKPDHDSWWRFAIVMGLMTGSAMMYLIDPTWFDYKFQTNLPSMALAGFLVGFGTRLGSGCTSGHGVCGLPRFSLRSLIATTIFMLTAMATVFLRGEF